MRRLADAGIGEIIPRRQVAKDKVLPKGKACEIFLKPHYFRVNESLFQRATGKGLDLDLYTENFNKPFDDTISKLIEQYHPHRHLIFGRPPPNRKVTLTALDLLTDTQSEGELTSGMLTI